MTFSTQEILLFRNAASREIVVGAENRVEQCVYAAVITRVGEEMADEVTGGWKVIEVGLVSRSRLFARIANIDIDILLCRWHAGLQGRICSYVNWIPDSHTSRISLARTHNHHSSRH